MAVAHVQTPTLIVNKRSRIVSFRLSDEEYDSLKTISTNRGARSVSEFTRSVACNNAGGDERIEEMLRTMNQRMQEIDQQLHALIDVLKPPVDHQGYEKEEQGK
jgi:hypothetical protein